MFKCNFFQVTKVEKRASRKRFLKSRRSRDFGMFSRCPFFNRGNLEKISNYTRTIFLTVCKNNYDNRLLFRNVLVFSYENQVFCIKIRSKKGWVINPPRKNFFHRKLWGKIFLHRKLWGKIFLHRKLWKKFFLGGDDSPYFFYYCRNN